MRDEVYAYRYYMASLLVITLVALLVTVGLLLTVVVQETRPPLDEPELGPGNQ